jgi:hypothetical protein
LQIKSQRQGVIPDVRGVVAGGAGSLQDRRAAEQWLSLSPGTSVIVATSSCRVGDDPPAERTRLSGIEQYGKFGDTQATTLQPQNSDGLFDQIDWVRAGLLALRSWQCLFCLCAPAIAEVAMRRRQRHRHRCGFPLLLSVNRERFNRSKWKCSTGWPASSWCLGPGI